MAARQNQTQNPVIRNEHREKGSLSTPPVSPETGCLLPGFQLALHIRLGGLQGARIPLSACKRLLNEAFDRIIWDTTRGFCAWIG